MAQFQRMDACLDTLSTKLYQVNICVGCIVRRQVTMGGFAPEASPPPLPPMASNSNSEDENEDDDDGDDDDTFDDNDGDARSTNEMST